MKNNYPYVSFIIVARNAEIHLLNAFADFVAQDYPKEKIEFLLVDGKSYDNSKRIAEDFASANRTIKFRLIENPKKILSSGWNCALNYAKGDIFLRIDAHARIPANFISKNVEAILTGQSIVGGPVICKLPAQLWPRIIALADRSRFGGGSADFRNIGPAQYVDTLAYAAYKREVFEKAGGYNEILVRNQDNEMHSRMKKAGYKFWFNPEIYSDYIPRAELWKLLKQKFGNGYWIAPALVASPKCFGLRHFIPFLFVVALIITGFIAMSGIPWPFFLLFLTYCLSALFFAVKSVKQESIEIVALSISIPFIFFLMHLSYGLGTLCGLFLLLFKAKEFQSYTPPSPISNHKVVKSQSIEGQQQ